MLKQLGCLFPLEYLFNLFKCLNCPWQPYLSWRCTWRHLLLFVGACVVARPSPSAPDPSAEPAPPVLSTHKPANRKLALKCHAAHSMQADTTEISGSTKYLLFDVCALAEHLVHNNFESFVQEELALRVINKRLIQVMEIGRFFCLPICCCCNS